MMKPRVIRLWATCDFYLAAWRWQRPSSGLKRSLLSPGTAGFSAHDGLPASVPDTDLCSRVTQAFLRPVAQAPFGYNSGPSIRNAGAAWTKAYGFEARGRMDMAEADLESRCFKADPNNPDALGGLAARRPTGGQHGAGQQLFGGRLRAAQTSAPKPAGGEEMSAQQKQLAQTGAGGQAGRGREVCGGDGDLPPESSAPPLRRATGPLVYYENGVGDRRRPTALHRGAAGAGEQVSPTTRE